MGGGKALMVVCCPARLVILVWLLLLVSRVSRGTNNFKCF